MVVTDKEITAKITEELQHLQENLEHCSLNHMNQNNPQTIFRVFKDWAIAIMRNRAKKIIPMAWKKINKLQEQLQMVLNDTTIPDNDCLLLSTDLREQINMTRQALHNSICDRSHLKMRVECESPTS